MSRWVAPLVAGILAGGATFAASAALRADDDPSAPATGEKATSGQAVFARMACGGCHTLAAAGADAQHKPGPDLDDRLPGYTRATLKAKITNPYPDRRPSDQEFVGGMPTDFAQRMTNAELDALVTYLLDTTKPAQSG